MAIISVKEGFSGVEAGGSDKALTATRTFSVVTDAVSDVPLDVFGAEDPVTGLSIPLVGDPHPTQYLLKAARPHIATVCPTFFNVKVNYSTRPNVSSTQEDDPLDEPAVYSWSDAASTEPVDEDADGNALVNAAGEPFDPPLTKDFEDPVLTITRNQASFDPDVKLDYGNSVCAEVFWGAAIGRARMTSIKGDEQAGSPAYWTCVYVIQFRFLTATDTPASKAWYWRVLNHGFRYIGSGSKTYAFLDTNGQPLSQPSLLAADGSPLAASADPVWLYFRKYPSKEWAVLGLNNT